MKKMDKNLYEYFSQFKCEHCNDSRWYIIEFHKATYFGEDLTFDYLTEYKVFFHDWNRYSYMYTIESFDKLDEKIQKFVPLCPTCHALEHLRLEGKLEKFEKMFKEE